MSQALRFEPDRRPEGQPVVTLRSLIDQRRSSGQRFQLAEVVTIVTPLCGELAALHAGGRHYFVHPSSVGAGPDGQPRLLRDQADRLPSGSRDRASLAPELASGTSPSARSSVFGVGALVYEMLTLRTVGHDPSGAIEPPSKVVPSLPKLLDLILAKALSSAPRDRPDDLAALAQAIGQLAGAPAPAAPAPVVEDRSFEVDVQVSLPPPAPPVSAPRSVARQETAPTSRAVADDPFAIAVDRSAASAPVADRATEELATLKARLEADRTPRWMVVKDKMDHGPFAAIELLQQIASHSFHLDHELVNMQSGQRCKLKDHPEFSRFAHHAHLHREEVKEKRAVVAAEKFEKTASTTKFVFGALAVISLLGVVGFVVYRIQKSRADAENRRREEEALVIAGEGSIKAKVKEKPKFVGGGGGAGYAGRSYEEAMKQTVSTNGDDVLMPNECAAPISGEIAASCGLNGKATAKVWVQRGRAVGVTVVSDPAQPGVNACMAGRIAGLSWRSVPGGSGCIRTFTVH